MPDAQLSTGQLALDIIGTDETLETDKFEVVVAGLELDDPTVQRRAGSEGFRRLHARTRRRRLPSGDQPTESRPGHHYRRHHHRIRLPSSNSADPPIAEAAIR